MGWGEKRERRKEGRERKKGKPAKWLNLNVSLEYKMNPHFKKKLKCERKTCLCGNTPVPSSRNKNGGAEAAATRPAEEEEGDWVRGR